MRARAELGDGVALQAVGVRYLVASDASADELRRAVGTVERVDSALNLEFFATPRAAPLLIYLFGDATSYDAYNVKAFGAVSDTPYGFYSSAEDLIVMNLATGTGTLAHELVHPLIAVDFPAVPSWFNEGFASLFEQSEYTAEGRMRGLVNWRFEGLLSALDAGEVALRPVMLTTTEAFYGEESGLNYAIARYLCLYLQEQGQLAAYYRAFREGVGEDPSGIATLESVLASPLDDIEKAWKDWLRVVAEREAAK